MMNTSGLEVRAEDGTLSRFRRNPETGELYDPGTSEVPRPPVEGITQSESENEIRRLLNRVPANQPASAVVNPSNVADYFQGLPL